MQNKLKVSIIIPTLNSEFLLEKCLIAINNQNYPKDRLEIIISDGGSRDNTLKIADKYNCRIINNKKRLAEPGIDLGIKNATGNVCTIIAVDNILEDKDFLNKITKPLYKDDIHASYSNHLSKPEDNWLTKYINQFTDPFNHFVYGNASNVRTFEKCYNIMEKNREYTIYQFNKKNYPMLAFAQGFTIKCSYQRPNQMQGDDLLPIVDLISQNKKMAYVRNTGVVHHCMNSFNHYVKKQRWAIDNYLQKKDYGISSRQGFFSIKRRLKMYVWPFYAVSIVFPVLRSIYGLITDKTTVWIYHPMMNFITVFIVLFEIIRVKFFMKTNIIERQ